MSRFQTFRLRVLLSIVACLLPIHCLSATDRTGHTLEVGPGKKYALPSQAIAAARDGDTIQIDPAGNYFNDVALIDKGDLTIESAGEKRAEIKTDGRVCGRKGIWVFAANAKNLTIRGIDFEGARVSDADGANGAGLRAQGTNLTVQNCRFFNNQNGILGGAGTVTVEHCEFDHNGLTGLSHNLYISEQTTQLTFRFNYSHDTVNGHLLKSRAVSNLIAYNRLSDDAGTGSYEVDLPNGGVADIVGNLIQQSAGSQNGIIVAYGEEGVTHPKSELNVIHNTFINSRSNGTFISVQKLPAGFHLELKNNIFAGPGTVLNTTATQQGGNLITPIDKAGFIDPANPDLHLKPDSPARNIGIDPGADISGESLIPKFEYGPELHEKPRPAKQKADAGAYGLEGGTNASSLHSAKNKAVLRTGR